MKHSFAAAAFSSSLLLAALAGMAACEKKPPADIGTLPELGDPEALSQGKGQDQNFTAVVGGFEYLYRDPNNGGRETHLYAARVEPGPQGTKILTEPKATVTLAANRVLVLTADKATFIMPGNTPREGLFAGSPKNPVVFTLYECEKGKVVSLKGGTDMRMRVFFDGEARFDLERDAVQSATPVHVTGPMLDLCGTGLQLTWNRLEQRMAQLDIQKGQVLCYQTPDEKDNGKPKTLASPLAPHQAKRSLHTPSDRDLVLYWDGPLQLRPVDNGSGDEDEPVTLYHAILKDKVRGIRRGPSAQDEIHFSGAQLDIQFSLNNPNESAKTKDAPPLPVLPGASDRNLIALLGSLEAPATVRTGKGEAISGARLTFAQGSGRVAVMGDDRTPVSLRTPDGWLTGTRLDLDPGTGKAFVFGPGQLESAPLRQGANADQAKAAPLRASYEDHLEMDFTVEKAKPGQPPRLGDPIETRLLGTVKASHPDFSLACGRLALGFGKEKKAGGDKMRPVLNRVDISQDHPVVALRDPKQGSVTIQASAMRLDMAQVAGEPTPTGFAAAGPVKATQGDGSLLTCDRLDVDFIPPGAKDKQAKPHMLRATGNAHYQGLADGKQASVNADSFAVDAIKNSLDLTGSATQYASVETQGMSLAGEKVFLQKDSGIARVPGPGRLTLVTQEKQHLAVSWQGKMAWNDAAGAGLFEEKVECAADSPSGESTLHADKSLRLQVDPGAQADGKKVDAKKRDLRLADARGKVVFASTQKDANGALAGRVRVDGETLLVKNQGAEQTISVPVKGVMLVENFQQKKETAKGADSTFGGRGATFFSWKKSMLMDLAQNDLHLLNDVEIRHLPLKTDNQYAPMSESIVLLCQEAHADLTETGGLGGLHNKQAPKGAVSMREVKCDYGITLKRASERIECDHLLYTGKSQTATLWCNPPRRVELFAKDQETPAAADRVVWHVEDNRLEVEHPSGGILPGWK